jgi:ATP-dependent RNA helicase MSS116
MLMSRRFLLGRFVFPRVGARQFSSSGPSLAAVGFTRYSSSGKDRQKFKKRNKNEVDPRGLKKRYAKYEDYPDLKRNRVKKVGPEGDGLRGMEDYPVKVEDLTCLHWTDMQTDGVPSSDPGFSNVQTEALSKHKVVYQVLVNSLRYQRNYQQLTPVQAQTVLPIMQNHSMVVRAKTGTGKTAAFSVPTIHKVIEAKRANVEGVKAVIISPTRELAQQISDEICQITSYGEMRQIRVGCFVGGLSKSAQMENGFERYGPVDIVVATPGRLLDLLHENHIRKHFSNVSIKVLDEADRLLEIGFKETLHDIDNMMKKVHHEEFQTLLFSATTDRSMMNFAKHELGSDVKIVDTVDKNEPQAQELVSQHAVECNGWSETYFAATQNVDAGIRENGPYKAIVFLPTVILVKHFGEVLRQYVKDTFGNKSTVQVIHGQLTQGQRQRAADKFRSSDNAVLVTTDVVARGMDFPNVTHVLQMGAISDVASYIHRIGRTARIGHSGKSYLYYSNLELPFIQALRKKNIKIEKNDKFSPDTKVVDKVTEVCLDLQSTFEEDPASLYNSLFASYMGAKKQYGFRGRNFTNEQEGFGMLIGAYPTELRPFLKNAFLKREFKNRDKREGGLKNKLFWH